jgi:hypothetical protein
VLEAVAACFDIFLEAPEPGRSTAVQTRLNELRVGDLLAEDVFTTEGTLLVPTGSEITPPLIHKLRNFARLGALGETLLIRRQAAEPQTSTLEQLLV